MKIKNLLGKQIFSAYRVKTGNCETDRGLSCWFVVNKTQSPVSKLIALHDEFVRHCSIQSVSRVLGNIVINSDDDVNT